MLISEISKLRNLNNYKINKLINDERKFRFKKYFYD